MGPQAERPRFPGPLLRRTRGLSLSELRELVRDREAWRAAIHGNIIYYIDEDTDWRGKATGSVSYREQVFKSAFTAKQSELRASSLDHTSS